MPTKTEERAEWSAAFINDLPDSSFLYIEPGGTKDDAGKTAPRSLRHFPVKDASGAVDMPHLRNALSRIPQSSLSQDVKDRVAAMAQKMMDAMNRSAPDPEFEVRGTDLWPDEDIELRATGDGLTLEGYAAVFDKPSVPIPGGPRGPFTETIRPGAFTGALARSPDVMLRYQHNLTTLPLARTRSGTLALSETERGLFARAELPDNEIGRPVRDAIRRGDISGMSFRFRVPSKQGEKWSSDYSTRELREVVIGSEISVVDFPAYPDTSVAVRHLAEVADLEPDKLAEAFDALRDPETKLTPDQRDTLYAAIAPKVDEPHIPPKLAQMRERFASAFPQQ
jgi:Escherichia/Staphylococcus phage prohead protease